MNENKWPAFEINSWKSIPVIHGKTANQNDVENGNAVFYLTDTGAEHEAAEIELPKLAYLTNENDDNKVLVVMIQAEYTGQGIVIGYRNPKGGSGACLLYELEFLTATQIETLEK